MATIKMEVLQKTVTLFDKTNAKIISTDGTKAVDYTVLEGFRRALNGSYVEEQPSQGKEGISFDEKMKRYELSKKIWNYDQAKGADLSVDDLKLLKTCVGKMFNGEALGFLVDIIEGK